MNIHASPSWKGVLIEESLTDKIIPSEITIVKTKTATLEGEKNKGEFHFHDVEVVDDNLNGVIIFVSMNIQDAWYFHLVKGDEMVVMFRNKSFNAHKKDKDAIENIRQYGLSQGILREQLELENLFENPFG